MTNTNISWIIPIGLALSSGLFVWFIIETGTEGLSRYRERFTQRTDFQMKEFFLSIDASRLFLAHLGLMSLGGCLAWLLSGQAWLALITFFILIFCPRWIYAWMRQRRLEHFESQLPDALLMLSGCLKAGSSLVSGIHQLVSESTAPLKQELSLLLKEQRLGLPLEHSLSHLSRRVPTPSTILMVSAMRIASETGGGLAETLERTAHTVRHRLQMESKISALTAQGKLQAWVVGCLPIALAFILHYLEPDMMSLLWHTRIGWGTLAILSFLECMGVYLVRKIVRIDV
jgi:tight adherence protein B